MRVPLKVTRVVEELVRECNRCGAQEPLDEDARRFAVVVPRGWVRVDIEDMYTAPRELEDALEYCPGCAPLVREFLETRLVRQPQVAP